MRGLFQLFSGDFFSRRNMKLLVKRPRMLNGTLDPLLAATTCVVMTAYDSPDITSRPAGVLTL